MKPMMAIIMGLTVSIFGAGAAIAEGNVSPFANDPLYVQQQAEMPSVHSREALEEKKRRTDALYEEKVLEVNHELIRKWTDGLDRSDAETVVNATLNDMSVCFAFRHAQKNSAHDRGEGDPEAYWRKAKLHELHQELFAKAAGLYFNQPKLSGDIKRQLQVHSRDMILAHYETMAPDRSDTQQKRFETSLRKCDRVESMLRDDIETPAWERMPVSVLEAERTNALLEELKAQGAY